jgi:hypothetical protein
MQKSSKDQTYHVQRQNLLTRIAQRQPKLPSDPPLIFKTKSNPRLLKLNLRDCLTIPEQTWSDPASLVVFNNRNPIICLQRPDNIGDLVNCSKYKLKINEEFTRMVIPKEHLSESFRRNNSNVSPGGV